MVNDLLAVYTFITSACLMMWRSERGKLRVGNRMLSGTPVRWMRHEALEQLGRSVTCGRSLRHSDVDSSPCIRIAGEGV